MSIAMALGSPEDVAAAMGVVVAGPWAVCQEFAEEALRESDPGGPGGRSFDDFLDWFGKHGEAYLVKRATEIYDQAVYNAVQELLKRRYLVANPLEISGLKQRYLLETGSHGEGVDWALRGLEGPTDTGGGGYSPPLGVDPEVGRAITCGELRRLWQIAKNGANWAEVGRLERVGCAHGCSFPRKCP